ncbi:hypothetical protein ACFP1Z_30715 [Streptomyces gamaensis]|uniref:Peptidoglycan-binding protein n=1 Tax=Streptomyces gamaensis TaxID=1763542 RepID=A0ABW0Z6T9_9ACTN
MAASTDPARPGVVEEKQAAAPYGAAVGKRRTVLVVGALAVVAAVAGGVWTFVPGGTDKKGTAVELPELRFERVVKTDLANVTELSGTLGYGTERKLKGGKKGLVTRLPEAGATAERGKPLYWVDDRPVVVFFGGTPLFRTLEVPAKGKQPIVGRDVKVVADNLTALGYDIGAQERTGQPRTAPSGTAPAVRDQQLSEGRLSGGQLSEDTVEFTPGLSAALKRWQRAVGMEATGTLQVGDLAVLPGTVRVSGVLAALGDDATGEVLAVTSNRKAVTVPMDINQSGQAGKGARATVVLPDGTEAEAKVEQVGRVTRTTGQDSGDGQAPQKLDVTVVLDDDSAAKALDTASVRVRFVAETRRGVLAVPVGALTALREGGYAVQLPDRSLVAVKTGMFARGMVEISGRGVQEGTRVVTSS